MRSVLAHRRRAMRPYWRSLSSKPDEPSPGAPPSQLVWTAKSDEPHVWTQSVADGQSLGNVLDRIERQEWQGGRLRARQLGVLHEDPATDMELLTVNYTVAALASALRDREDALQAAALLAEQGQWQELRDTLAVFHPRLIIERRRQSRRLNVTNELDSHALEIIRKALMRRPRTVTQAHSRRAGVVIPLCQVDGVPSLLLEKRSSSIRAHPDEVCLPGGMVCEIEDKTIVNTCVREMQEEIIGIEDRHITVLGVFRCNWGEVHHLVGVAVTPVVCFVNLPDKLRPNVDEVAEVFTLPLASLLDKHLWVHKEGMAPVFLGGPHVIWGLTGYILDRFYKDILLPNSQRAAEDDGGAASLL